MHVDKNGNEIVSAKYYDDDWMIRGIEPFACGLAKVKRNGKYGYINTKGEEVIPCRYYSASSFYDDVAAVMKSSGSRVEIINKKGETLFSLKEGEFIYTPFINGLGLVANFDCTQFRYVNKKGETVYKWEEPKSEMPEKRLSPAEKLSPANRSLEFMLSTEYGPLFRDMMRNKEMQKSNSNHPQCHHVTIFQSRPKEEPVTLRR